MLPPRRPKLPWPFSNGEPPLAHGAMPTPPALHDDYARFCVFLAKSLFLLFFCFSSLVPLRVCAPCVLYSAPPSVPCVRGPWAFKATDGAPWSGTPRRQRLLHVDDGPLPRLWRCVAPPRVWPAFTFILTQPKPFSTSPRIAGRHYRGSLLAKRAGHPALSCVLSGWAWESESATGSRCSCLGSQSAEPSSPVCRISKEH